MPLTWALAIATYNRPEALRRSVLCALEQTRPPCEIIIVDSSPSQPSSQQDIQDLVLQSGANVRVFEADASKQIAAVGPAPAATPPDSAIRTLTFRRRPLPIRRARIIHGYRMIVRRDIARTCRFDENLAAGLHEDLDASYRFAQQGALVDLELPLIYHDRAPRPAEQPRKGSIERYSWIAGHVYLARQYFGHGLYVRLHAYFSMWRYLPLDLIDAIRRGNGARLRGTIEGLKAAWRLAMAPAERTGPIYAEGCRAYREQLIRRS